jgi:hypothetical protein
MVGRNHLHRVVIAGGHPSPLALHPEPEKVRNTSILLEDHDDDGADRTPGTLGAAPVTDGTAGEEEP